MRTTRIKFIICVIGVIPWIKGFSNPESSSQNSDFCILRYAYSAVEKQCAIHHLARKIINSSSHTPMWIFCAGGVQEKFQCNVWPTI